LPRQRPLDVPVSFCSYVKLAGFKESLHGLVVCSGVIRVHPSLFQSCYPRLASLQILRNLLTGQAVQNLQRKGPKPRHPYPLECHEIQQSVEFILAWRPALRIEAFQERSHLGFQLREEFLYHHRIGHWLG